MGNFILRVLLADDHPAILLGLESALKANGEIQIIGKARNSTEIMEILKNEGCDVLITDYSMPGGIYGDGSIMINFIKKKYPDVKIVVMTMIESMAVIRSLTDQGIYRIIHKSDSLGSLLPAIYAAYTGGRYVSPSAGKYLDEKSRMIFRSFVPKISRKENEVLMLFVSGMTVSEIARELYRSIKTVSSHKISVMSKLGIRKDADLIRYGVEMGWVDSKKNDAKIKISRMAKNKSVASSAKN